MKCGGCNGTGKVPGCFMDWYPCGRCQPDVPKAEAVPELKAAPMLKCTDVRILAGTDTITYRHEEIHPEYYSWFIPSLEPGATYRYMPENNTYVKEDTI